MSRAARISRGISLRMVMEAVIHGGPISRASIARQTGLSKQTTSEIARILETDGWIRETGRTSGHVGRMATTYEVVPDAALFAAVDLGGTKTRTAIADLSCRIVAEEVEPTAAEGGRHACRQADALRHGVGRADGGGGACPRGPRARRPACRPGGRGRG